MDRAKRIADLRRLAEHPTTNPHEAANAREELQRLGAQQDAGPEPVELPGGARFYSYRRDPAAEAWARAWTTAQQKQQRAPRVAAVMVGSTEVACGVHASRVEEARQVMLAVFGVPGAVVCPPTANKFLVVHVEGGPAERDRMRDQLVQALRRDGWTVTVHLEAAQSEKL